MKGLTEGKTARAGTRTASGTASNGSMGNVPKKSLASEEELVKQAKANLGDMPVQDLLDAGLTRDEVKAIFASVQVEQALHKVARKKLEQGGL